jgi:hypothetical protein
MIYLLGHVREGHTTLRQMGMTTFCMIIAVGAIALAMLSLAISQRALGASIPAPSLRRAYRGILVIKMLPSDEAKFGITKLRMCRGKMQAFADLNLQELENALRGSRKMGPWTKTSRWEHGAISIILRVSPDQDCKLRACIGSRSDGRIYRWVNLEC